MSFEAAIDEPAAKRERSRRCTRHLFNSAVIGAILVWLFRNRAVKVGSGLAWGALYGILWWILGAQILMPLALGMPPFASIMMPPADSRDGQPRRSPHLRPDSGRAVSGVRAKR